MSASFAVSKYAPRVSFSALIACDITFSSSLRSSVAMPLRSYFFSSLSSDEDNFPSSYTVLKIASVAVFILLSSVTPFSLTFSSITVLTALPVLSLCAVACAFCTSEYSLPTLFENAACWRADSFSVSVAAICSASALSLIFAFVSSNPRATSTRAFTLSPSTIFFPLCFLYSVSYAASISAF